MNLPSVNENSLPEYSTGLNNSESESNPNNLNIPLQEIALLDLTTPNPVGPRLVGLSSGERRVSSFGIQKLQLQSRDTVSSFNLDERLNDPDYSNAHFGIPVGSYSPIQEETATQPQGWVSSLSSAQTGNTGPTKRKKNPKNKNNTTVRYCRYAIPSSFLPLNSKKPKKRSVHSLLKIRDRKPEYISATSIEFSDVPRLNDCPNLFHFAGGKEKALMITSFAINILSGIMLPMGVFCAGQFLDAAAHKDVDKINLFCLLQVLAGVSAFFMSWAGTTLQVWAAENQYASLKAEFVHSVLNQDQSFMDSHDAGELANAISTQGVLFRQALGNPIVQLVTYASQFISGFVVALLVNWGLALSLLPMVPVLLGGGAFTMHTLASAGKKTTETYARAAAVVEETLMHIRTVIAYGLEPFFSKLYDEKVYHTYRVAKKGGLGLGLGMGISMGSLFAFYALGFWLEANFMIKQQQQGTCLTSSYQGCLTVGKGMIVFFCIAFGSFSLGQAAPPISALVKGTQALKYLAVIMARPSEIPVFRTKAIDNLPDLTGSIQFRDVAFVYQKPKNVLSTAKTLTEKKSVRFNQRKGNKTKVPHVHKAIRKDKVHARKSPETSSLSNTEFVERQDTDSTRSKENDLTKQKSLNIIIPHSASKGFHRSDHHTKIKKFGRRRFVPVEAMTGKPIVGNYVFFGLNIDIHPGQSVAFVGASGCGKSTIVKMIMRFIDATEGNIMLDNTDIIDLDVQWLRSQIGYIGQEPQLFSTTIWENIKCGNPSASPDQILAASKAANAHSFIMTFPHEYNTQVGEGGGLLSGGQKQRIAIARALVRDPKILILDEATSALDNESEKLVQATIDGLLAQRNRTVLMIAHRLSTIRNADVIVVFNRVTNTDIIKNDSNDCEQEFKGAVVAEMGTHDELVNIPDGIYAAMAAAQSLDVRTVGRQKSSRGGTPKAKRSISNFGSPANSRKQFHISAVAGATFPSTVEQKSLGVEEPDHFEAFHPHQRRISPAVKFLTGSKRSTIHDAADKISKQESPENSLSSALTPDQKSSAVHLDVIPLFHPEPGHQAARPSSFKGPKKLEDQAFMSESFIFDAADSSFSMTRSASGSVYSHDYSDDDEHPVYVDPRERIRSSSVCVTAGEYDMSMNPYGNRIIDAGEDEACHDPLYAKLTHSRASRRRAYPYMKSGSWIWAAGFSGAVASSTVFPLFALIFSKFIVVLASQNVEFIQDNILLPVVSLLLVSVGCFLANIVQHSCLEIGGQKLTRDLRSQVFEHILYMPASFFDRKDLKAGYLLEMLSKDTLLFKGWTSDNLSILVQNVGTLVTALIIAWAANSELALVSLGAFAAMAPAIVLQAKFMSSGATSEPRQSPEEKIKEGRRKKRRFSTQKLDLMEETEYMTPETSGRVFTEAVRCGRTVAAYGLQEEVAMKYDQNLVKERHAGHIGAIKIGLCCGVSQFFQFAAQALSLWYGGNAYASEKIPDLGTMMQGVFTLIIAALSIGQSASMATNSAAGKEAVVRILSILDIFSNVDARSMEGFGYDELLAEMQENEGRQKRAFSSPWAKSADRKTFELEQKRNRNPSYPTLFTDSGKKSCLEKIDFRGKIKFTNLYFTYPTRPDQPIYKSLNFIIGESTSAALVGESGCGKTTAIQLLERFYELPPRPGSTICIDGIDIRDWNIKYLRSKMALVSQEPILFNTSVRENIRLGDLDACDEQVIEAAKMANAHEFIQELPGTYDFAVGVRGERLSGGQRQRIAIARALIRAPAVLLLDEATSALDAISERIVQQTLDELLQNAQLTIVMVAHRLSTVRAADQIVVLKRKIDSVGKNQGAEVRETGSHDELMQKENGEYRRLVEMTDS